MKHRRFIAFTAGLTCIAFLGACSPPKSRVVTSNPQYVDKKALKKKGDFTLPKNAGSEKAQKQIVLYMKISTTRSGPVALTPGAEQSLNNFIEAQVPRLKRFKVYGVYNTGARRLVEEMADQGRMAASESGELPAADALLNISIDIQTETNVFAGAKDPTDGKPKDTVVVYKVDTKASLQDSTGRVLTSQNFVGIGSRDVVEIRKPDGSRQFVGGFDPNDPGNVNTVLQSAARKVLTDIAAMLGETYPVTGRVTGMSASGGRMSMDKGVEQGLTNETQVVVWADDDDGVATALAYANCEALDGRSTLNIWGWNTSSPDASPIIAKIQKDPASVKSMKMYATSIGLPVPEQWKEP
ncbi:MAG: hypothetical protein WCK33_06665 [Phycisphaerae bacterium]